MVQSERKQSVADPKDALVDNIDLPDLAEFDFSNLNMTKM